MTPLGRSIKYLEKAGWVVDTVERTINTGRIVFKRDLFTIGDAIAIRGEQTLLIQSTSADNVSSRVRKIAECPFIAAIRKAGWLVHVHGWKKVNGRWTPRVVDCS